MADPIPDLERELADVEAALAALDGPGVPHDPGWLEAQRADLLARRDRIHGVLEAHKRRRRLELYGPLTCRMARSGLVRRLHHG